MRKQKLFPIFKQLEEPVNAEVVEEPIQPSGRTVASLRELCEENVKSRSRMVKTLWELCREKLRNLLCTKVDTQETNELLKNDCHECGKGIHGEDRESYIIGSDVVALFPSIKSR